jgi:adenylate cyclase
VSQEIERKFLLANDGWKSSVVRKVRIRDGLVAILNGRKARVRLIGEHATITLKGRHQGLGRSEFEYPIPTPDAEEILKTMCDDRILEKTRHYVPHGGLTWEIDVYEGLLEGVVIAEVELDHAGRVLELPDWAGREVTGDQRYSKFNMEKGARRRAWCRALHAPQARDAAFSLAGNEGLGSNCRACNHFSGENHA